MLWDSIKVDDQTIKGEKCRFVRVCIEIDLPQPVKQGHHKDMCPDRSGAEKEQASEGVLAYGAWLRSFPPRRRSASAAIFAGGPSRGRTAPQGNIGIQRRPKPSTAPNPVWKAKLTITSNWFEGLAMDDQDQPGDDQTGQEKSAKVTVMPKNNLVQLMRGELVSAAYVEEESSISEVEEVDNDLIPLTRTE